MTSYILIALAAVATIALVSIRFLLAGFLERIGAKALDKQPDAIRLQPLLIPAWSDQAKMESLANPLLLLGFSEVGVFSGPELKGVKIRFLLHEPDEMAAFVYEHPKAGVWLELSVRYQDGTTTALSNRFSAGLSTPPFFRLLRADPSTPPGEMYRRLLSERSPTGIKHLTRDAVVPEYELAYAKIMLWTKNRGLTAEEVARVAAKLAEQKRAR